ncbi:hypothetical protein L195_g001224, partial [Trifolium pratense]
MDLKRECDRETKEDQDFNEDSIQTIMFTLAILFMSMKPNYWSSRNLESESNIEDMKNDDKLKKSACGISQENKEECYTKQCWTSASISTNHSISTNDVHVENEIDEEEEEEDEHVEVLSKEELNERVEAFIAMFRKHLSSDDKQ